ncbi:MAG: hypothetical protein MJK18_12440 [Bdellovibrionales bacterium]|nr:hypothetical protein [Bdellovibrionales bacterium]
MEALITIVGFLGAGKTTLLKRLVNHYHYGQWSPFVILNDYETAMMDAQYFSELLNTKQINAISGSCICCSGIVELREAVNNILERPKGITFIEANGTTDATTLMGFLGVGLKDQFLPPIQIAVVDARHWQKRGDGNELESHQVQISSMIVINYAEDVDESHLKEVINQIKEVNSSALITKWQELDADIIPKLTASTNESQKMDHGKSHWSSCSVDLPDPMNKESLNKLLEALPGSVLRVKGCTRLGPSEEYTFFEKTPSGETFFRPFKANLVSGPKILLIGPGSDPQQVKNLLQ